jgi:hypothetical protein
MCVTETPEGFFTPLEAQPLASAMTVTVERDFVSFAMSGFMVWVGLKGLSV